MKWSSKRKNSIKNLNVIKKEKPNERSFKKREILSISLATLSLLATFLTLIGYGVSHAIDQFGLPAESLSASTFDLLDISTWAVLYFITNWGKFSFQSYYLDALSAMFPGVLGGIIGLLIILTLLKIKPHVVSIKIHHKKIWQIIKPINKSDSNLMNSIKFIFYIICFWLLLPIFYFAIGLLILCFSAALFMAPIIGYEAGKAHIEKDVLEPDICAPLKIIGKELNVTRRSKQKTYATCVSLKTDRMQEEIRGRVVLTTSSNIILYDPSTGIATRMPIKDAIIHNVDSLE